MVYRREGSTTVSSGLLRRDGDPKRGGPGGMCDTSIVGRERVVCRLTGSHGLRGQSSRGSIHEDLSLDVGSTKRLEHVEEQELRTARRQ